MCYVTMGRRKSPTKCYYLVTATKGISDLFGMHRDADEPRMNIGYVKMKKTGKSAGFEGSIFSTKIKKIFEISLF